MPPVVRRLPAYEPPVGGPARIPLPRPRPTWVPVPEPPPPTLDAGRLLSVVLEVLDGRRPARLLREVAVPVLAARLGGSVRPRTTRMVRPPRVCHPSRLVAEMSVTLRREGRVLAAACRAEHSGGRWWFTSFTVLE